MEGIGPHGRDGVVRVVGIVGNRREKPAKVMWHLAVAGAKRHSAASCHITYAVSWNGNDMRSIISDWLDDFVRIITKEWK
jgi:hypothetical protein